MNPSEAALLTANELTIAFGHQPLLDGVTFAVAPGEKVGLVGRNGCGKTTLLKILTGEIQADSGDIFRRRGLRVGYLPQEFELEDGKTARENIEAGAADLASWIASYEKGEGSEIELAELLHRIEAADGWNLSSRSNAIAGALAAPPMDAVVGPLSGGEKRRVALCRALAAQPDLLLLDEPTNHLDSESIRWLENFLASFPGAVMFVTHDRYFLDVIATRILELSDGRCFSHAGNYTAYLESKAVRQQIAEQAERRRQRFLRVELEWVKAGVRAQRSKSRHRLDSFYGIQGLEAPPEEREMDLLIPPAPPLGDIAVNAEDIGARVGDGDTTRWLFRGLTFSLKPGQCTGVVGRNGVGKTTLLRICMGERAPEEGALTIGRKVAFNYIDQARMELSDDKTVLQELSEGNEKIQFGERTLSARGYLRRFLFADERVNETVGKLSGGERARLMLAKVLRRGGNVLVLDEPTNDLDLPSLRMLEEALADFDGGVLVVSHDRYFLDRICDQIIAFEDGGIFIQPGNFSYYLEKRGERETRSKPYAQSAPEPSDPPDKGAASRARPRRIGYMEKRELEGMEEAILEAESRVEKLERTLNDPEFYTTRAKDAPARHRELEEARSEVARLYARWTELDELAKNR